MKTRVKLRELRNADVQYVSLVDRAASRIPFRILKRDKGNPMLDLSKLTRMIKGEKPTPPEITGVAVLAKTPEQNEAVKTILKQSGFATEVVEKVGESLFYPQSENYDEDQDVMIRMSDQMVVTVKGFTGEIEDDHSFSEAASSQGFFQGLNASLDMLYSKMNSALTEADSQEDANANVKKLLKGFSDHVMALVEALPSKAFKADKAVREAVQKMEATPDAESHAAGGNQEVNNSTEDKIVKADCDKDKDMMSEEEKAKMKEQAKKDEEAGAVQSVAPEPEQAKKEEEKKDAPASEPAKEETVTKADFTKVLDAITGLTNTVSELAKKVEDNQKVVDTLTKKTETLDEKLGTTVLAAATPGDVPAKDGESGTAKKSDWRVGCFDSAFDKPRGR